MKKIGLLILFALSVVGIQAQTGSAFGVKGGLTIGTQKWNNFDRDPLFAWHGDVYIESLTEDNAFSLIASLGYHVRGSALRNQQFINPINGSFTTPSQNFEFYNTSLMLGAKQKFDFQENAKIYYLFGLRGEYTLGDNLEDYQAINNGFYPYPSGVRKINMGLTVGGGIEMMFSELVGGFLEVAIAPDITAQYRQQEIGGVRNPYTGNTQTLPERTIRNLSFEVSLGIRLLRIVEYID